MGFLKSFKVWQQNWNPSNVTPDKLFSILATGDASSAYVVCVSFHSALSAAVINGKGLLTSHFAQMIALC